MPTLIGAAAALAQSGRTIQLPTPVATAVLAKAKLERKRRRLRLLLSRYIDQTPFPEIRPCGRNLMKMMARTNTRTSAITGGITQGSAALSVPINPAPATGPANEP